MTDLSPAAQAVMDAALFEVSAECYAPWIAAAALRAAADQAHPKANVEDIAYTHQNYIDGWKDALDVILAIATELENHQ
jgi:predicted nicotinamide N-methyase